MKYDKREMVIDLKQFRKDAGLSQKELGRLIGVSRETVVAIECQNEASLNSLKMDLVKHWLEACKPSAKNALLKRFKMGIVGFFGL
jgi:DNA-binding XRE family transcriptional regulator